MGNTPSGSANEGGRSRPPVPATPATPAAPAAWDGPPVFAEAVPVEATPAAPPLSPAEMVIGYLAGAVGRGTFVALSIGLGLLLFLGIVPQRSLNPKRSSHVIDILLSKSFREDLAFLLTPKRKKKDRRTDHRSLGCAHDGRGQRARRLRSALPGAGRELELRRRASSAARGGGGGQSNIP